MQPPQRISEKMQYSTVRIVTTSGTGTGFFFSYTFEEWVIPVIITNKHVINEDPKALVTFSLHLDGGDDPQQVQFQTEWHFHPEQDLCFCFCSWLFQNVETHFKKKVYYIPLAEDLIWSNTKLEDLSAIEDVIMVGYPNWLRDKKNNLPLFRRWITSSHPAIDFNNKSIGVVDMACFPWSSGSPIFILNENGFSDKEWNIYIGKKRLIFLGILFSWPRMNAEGQVIIEEIPTQQKGYATTPLMINLGFYIKAFEILSFKEKIQKLIKSS